MQTRSCDLVGKEITVVMDAANWWIGIMVEILLKKKFQKSFTLRAYFCVCPNFVEFCSSIASDIVSMLMHLSSHSSHRVRKSLASYGVISTGSFKYKKISTTVINYYDLIIWRGQVNLTTCTQRYWK